MGRRKPWLGIGDYQGRIDFTEKIDWAIIIPAFGCADEVLREIKRFWDEMLVDYADWLALGGST